MDIKQKFRILTEGAKYDVSCSSSGSDRQYSMKRVYYSAYVPMGNPGILPVKPPDLVRENRLYQADWLMRFYGFSAEELLPMSVNLPYDVDPKSAWALRNIDKFPIEINTAPYEMILRVPGIGVKGAWRIVEARKFGRLTFEDLKRMCIVMKRASNFITCGGKYIGRVTGVIRTVFYTDGFPFILR